ncbi:hypothetical protein BpHYR1_035827 [Brachionus plicatilis]|uniref:Uncharacterized protein n=1 Tax=Brachionus plicatilis TaxID=10195 RepID=A0A3M7QTB7_BRAPC|nr:hypothetical protein BpHYR1_035827 [Brachionus plicatilis]
MRLLAFRYRSSSVSCADILTEYECYLFIAYLHVQNDYHHQSYLSKKSQLSWQTLMAKNYTGSYSDISAITSTTELNISMALFLNINLRDKIKGKSLTLIIGFKKCCNIAKKVQQKFLLNLPNKILDLFYFFFNGAGLPRISSITEIFFKLPRELRDKVTLAYINRQFLWNNIEFNFNQLLINSSQLKLKKKVLNDNLKIKIKKIRNSESASSFKNRECHQEILNFLLEASLEEAQSIRKWRLLLLLFHQLKCSELCSKKILLFPIYKSHIYTKDLDDRRAYKDFYKIEIAEND